MNRYTSLTLALAALSTTAFAQNPPAWKNASLPAAERAHDLVGQMTLEEKAQQLEDYATAIPRLGVPDYQTWNEALHGVARAGYATVFPQAIGLAATWDPTATQQVGDIIATEGRAKYNQAQREGNHRIFFGLTFWSPNINIFRDPRWGRGQETYGEDPYLTGQLAGNFIRGIQGPDADHPRAVATSKHFAVHSGPESSRHVFDAVVTPHDLEETYLPAFRSTVVDAHVKSVMCAYNAIDKHSACANTMLLKEHLRDAWHFNGFVVSDCAAIVDVTNGHHDAPDITHAAAISLKAGTDLSCSIWSPGFNTLAVAVKQHLVSEDLVTQAAERLYTARFQLGLFDHTDLDAIPVSEIASDAHRAVARKAAEESMVLLKNEGVLPLATPGKRIAVVGPTADLIVSLEGNYNGQPVRPVTPLDGLLTRFGASNIHYAQGSLLAEGASVPVPRTALPGGLHAEYFASTDGTGTPVATATVPGIQDDWDNAAPVPQLKTPDYSVRWTGKLRAPAAGQYTFVLEGQSPFPYSPKETYRFTLDGKVLAEGHLDGAKLEMGNFTVAPGASPTAPPIMTGSKPARISVTLNDTAEHDLRVDYSHSGDRSGGGLQMKWEAPAKALLDEAVTAASQSDIVVAFTGLSPDLEGEEHEVKIAGFEGGDRTTIGLPAAQQALLEAVAATGKPVIVVNLSGSAVALNWAKDHAAAVLQAWYPGVEGGTAIAETLAGTNNPAGRLPVTFYAGVDDLPAFTDYSMKNRTYKYYAGTPLWGFGYGMSYSTFRYDNVKLTTGNTLVAGRPLTATVAVRNTGKLAGDEVVEAYVKTPQVDGPRYALAGFQRVHLRPGESRNVSLTLNDRALSSVAANGDRSVLPGTYQLWIGGTQPAAAAPGTTFTVNGSVIVAK